MCPNIISENKKHIQRFLTSGLYMMRVTEVSEVKRLKMAHHTPASLQDQFGTQSLYTSLLARVKFLLGHGDSEVEKVFQQAINSTYPHDRPINKYNAFTMFGRYYEKCGEVDNAKTMYLKAKEVARATSLNPHIAERRMEALAAN